VKLDMVPSDQKPETQLDGIFGGSGLQPPAPPDHPSRATSVSAVHHAKKTTIDPLSTEVPEEPTELFTKWKKQQNSDDHQSRT
jgi:hypothetical protein